MIVEIPCVCGRHETDSVTLRDTLDFRAALTVRNAALMVRAADEEAGPAELLAALSEQYLLVGIESWTLADERGRPLPVNRGTIRSQLLERPEVAIIVADAADELYGEKVVLPLLLRVSNSSPPGPTAGSTSAPRRSSSRRPTPSSRSSTTSTRTGATATTSGSPAGASST